MQNQNKDALSRTELLLGEAAMKKLAEKYGRHTI